MGKKQGRPGSGRRRTETKLAQTRDPRVLTFPTHISENQVIEELRETVQKLRIFDSLGKTLTSSLDLSEILKMVVEKLGGLVNCRHFGLVLMDEASSEFCYEFPEEIAEGKHGFPLGKGIIGRSLERGKGGLFFRPLLDPAFDAEVDGLVTSHPESMITLPIMSRGSVLGLLVFFTEEGYAAFTESQFRLLETFSDYVTIAVQNARNYKLVQELTISDDLTKLYNSRYLHLVLDREIVRSERYKENLSIVFLDIDNFKDVNDQHGHMVGSNLLKEFGDFLLTCIRTSDCAIRYGGDEFVLVLPKTTKKEALHVVSRSLESLRSHVFLKGRHLNIRVTASFGISTLPEDGKTIDQLISAADRAMYTVKKSSKNGVLAYNSPITLIGSKA